MYQVKRLSKDAIPRALEKAEHYRVLNEPAQAESICLDILTVEPDHQQAMVTLVLALTDQFDSETAVRQARELLPHIRDEYQRAYYAGIVSERRAKARLDRGGPDSEFTAYEWFQEAMDWYEKAEAVRPSGNDDSLLRWNSCARVLMRNPHLRPRPPENGEEQPLE
jgi:hypothetical protein